MRIICVDDDPRTAEDTAALCRGMEPVDSAAAFTSPAEALRWLETEGADAAVLDIGMPEMSGLRMAEIIRERWPDTAVIFLTGSDRYAVDAFALHVSGYLLKPADREKLEREIVWAAETGKRKRKTRVTARTFGNFDLMLDGKPIAFRQAKCKELLAYLIDRRGANVNRREAFAILYEDRNYDRPMQKQLDVIIRALRATLRDYGIGEIFEMGRAVMRVNPDLISCDAWRYFEGDPEAVRSFFGEYMSNYSWASMTESAMSKA